MANKCSQTPSVPSYPYLLFSFDQGQNNLLGRNRCRVLDPCARDATDTDSNVTSQFVPLRTQFEKRRFDKGAEKLHQVVTIFQVAGIFNKMKKNFRLQGCCNGESKATSKNFLSRPGLTTFETTAEKWDPILDLEGLNFARYNSY